MDVSLLDAMVAHDPAKVHKKNSIVGKEWVLPKLLVHPPPAVLRESLVGCPHLVVQGVVLVPGTVVAVREIARPDDDPVVFPVCHLLHEEHCRAAKLLAPAEVAFGPSTGVILLSPLLLVTGMTVFSEIAGVGDLHLMCILSFVRLDPSRFLLHFSRAINT